MLAPLAPPEDVARIFNAEVVRARSGALSLAELFGAAERLNSANQGRLAAELYRNWIAFNESHELLYMACFNLSVILRSLDDYAGAINALHECVRLKPDFLQARINLGRVYEDSGNIGKALEHWGVALKGFTGVTAESLKLKLMTLQQMGRVLENAEQFEAAEDLLRQAIELRPDRTDSIQHWIALRQRQCKWPAIVRSEHVTTRELTEGLSPMSLALHADDPLFQLAKAYRYNRSLVGGARPLRLPANFKKAGERIRIGYVSSDLREHAVGFALVELFELHDKSKFEIFAYYFGEARPADETQGRFKKSVDHWIDIAQLDDDAAAAEIADDGIDILVDLNGYTKHARPGIFARRPAPVIVNWCGYPGTTGSPDHHYIIADAHIIPPEYEIFYSEKVLRIPCNQPLDRRRRIELCALTRADEDLPEGMFVFCCLNGMQKITSKVFALWMTILREAPRSVLWLLSGGDAVDERLRGAAGEQGVDPARILFAKKRPNALHLRRVALADLFLDTFPYGAHSTAADALTMGVPVLTRPGRSFASRFCASVVRAAGLGELICESADDYVRRAVEIGNDNALAKKYRHKLFQARDSCVLRDMNAAARRLEDLYLEMQDAREKGALPTPNLINLDAYYEIGADLDAERVNELDTAAYLDLYRAKLADLERRAPLSPDNRLLRR
jgi:predicted O-linked N-acetylglucosamine transferase (SPINDLY family)